ncbi:hypothetical protein ACFX1X_027804 [Malus domestica]
MVVALKLLKQLRAPHTSSTILHRNLSPWPLSTCRVISAVLARPPLNLDSPSLLCLNQYKLVKSAAIAETCAQAITYGKPILRSIVPSLCTFHFQMNQKNIMKALKKADLNGTLSSKFAPMFHVVRAECVRQTRPNEEQHKVQREKKLQLRKKMLIEQASPVGNCTNFTAYC